LQFNREGDLLFSASKSFEPNVWRADTGERIGTYQGHNGAVWYLDVTHDSKYMLTASADNTCRIFGVENGKELAVLKHKASVRSCGWNLGETRFFTITDNVMGNTPSIQIFEKSQEDDLNDQTSVPMATYQLGKPKVLHAKWVHLNQSIITASDDGAIRVYDAETGKCTAQAQPHRGAINRINFDKYEATFVSGSKDGTAKLFDARTLHVLKTFDTGRPINCAVMSPIKDHVIIAGGEEAQNVTTTRLDSSQFKVRFFHKVYGQEICSVMGHFGTVNTAAISPDGTSFASGAEDGYVRLHHMPQEYLDQE